MQSCGSGNAYTAATKLPNFASALTRQFQIVWTVTILQQAFRCSYGGKSGATIRKHFKHRDNRKSRTLAVCRTVEQGLALFPYLRAHRN